MVNDEEEEGEEITNIVVDQSELLPGQLLAVIFAFNLFQFFKSQVFVTQLPRLASSMHR